MKELVTSEPSRHAPLPEDRMPQKSWLYLFALCLSVMVGGFSSVCIKQLLLPIQASQLAPQNTTTTFTLVASFGALAGLLASPLVGSLSDRTSLRLGRRRPWIIVGIGSAVAGMGVMASASSVPILLVGEILAQIGVDSILAVTTALIPDQIPFAQRPLLSACVGIAPNMGGVIGLLLVSHLTNTRVIAQGYWLMAAVSLACILFFLLLLRDPPVSRSEMPAPFRLRSFLGSFIHPLSSPDFCWTFLSRCFAYLSFTLLGAYTLFYLQGGLGYPTPEAATRVATFQLVSTSVLILFALSAGWLSRRLHQLKPFVIGGSLAMAAGLTVIAVLPFWTGLLLAAVIFGAGFGLYLGVDITLAIRILPSAQARGKDLGLLYNAIYLTLIGSPLIGAGVLSLFPQNFGVLFGIAAFSSLLAAACIVPIRLVK